VVKVRVGGRLMDILSYVLGITAPENSEHIRLWGEAESIQVLRNLLHDFNLRTAAQRWLREHLNVESLWQKVRSHDPSWLSDFLPMPSLMRDTLIELRSLNQSLRQQQEEFLLFRADLRKQRAQDMVFLVLALGAFALAQRHWQPAECRQDCLAGIGSGAAGGPFKKECLGSVDVSLVVALLVKIAPDKARPTTCGGSTRGGRNAVWRDFDQQPFGTGL